MKSVVGLVVPLLFLASPAHADEYSLAVDSLRDFLGARVPSLYEGHDDVGECRVMIYSSSDSEASRVYLEGTFQYKTGPVSGFAINFFLSTSTADCKINSFQLGAKSVSTSAVYLTQGEELAIALNVEKHDEGTLSSIGYEVNSITRVCSSLRRLL